MAFAIGAGLVASGALGYLAATSAANTESNAASNASQTQWDIFEQEQANEQPYMQAGESILPELESAASPSPFNFKADPGYAWDLQQGQAALMRAASASGAGYGTGTIANLLGYSENAASNEYNNAYQRYQETINNNYNRLLGVAELGQGAVTGTNQAATNAGNNISANTIGAGNAAAAGTVGSANAVSGAVTAGTNYATLSSLMSGQAGPTPTAINNAFSSPTAPTLTMPQLGSSAGYGMPATQPTLTTDFAAGG